MNEDELVEEIKNLIGKTTNVCTPFIDDIYFKDAYDEYTDPGDVDKTVYGFGDDYRKEVFSKIPTSRKKNN